MDPGAVRGVTAGNGIAKLTINTEEGLQSLIITVCSINILITYLAVYLADRSAEKEKKKKRYIFKWKQYLHW